MWDRNASLHGGGKIKISDCAPGGSRLHHCTICIILEIRLYTYRGLGIILMFYADSLVIRNPLKYYSNFQNFICSYIEDSELLKQHLQRPDQSLYQCEVLVELDPSISMFNCQSKSHWQKVWHNLVLVPLNNSRLRSRHSIEMGIRGRFAKL